MTEQKNRTRKYAVAIAVLSVLLVLTSAMLLIVLLGAPDGSSVSRDNVIGTRTESDIRVPAPPRGNELGAAPVGSTILSAFFVDDNDLSLSWWTGYDGDKNFSVSNMFSGDSETRKYEITVKNRNAVSLLFKPTVTADSLLSEIMTITVKANDTTLYNGLVKDASETSFPLASNTRNQKVTYEITVALPESADNTYAGLSLTMNFLWSLDEKVPVAPPVTTPVDTTTPEPPVTTPDEPDDTTTPPPPVTTPDDTTTPQPPVTTPDEPDDTTTPPVTDPIEPPPGPGEPCKHCIIDVIIEKLFGHNGNRCVICDAITDIFSSDEALCICPWGCLLVVILIVLLLLLIIFIIIFLLVKSKDDDEDDEDENGEGEGTGESSDSTDSPNTPDGEAQ